MSVNIPKHIAISVEAVGGIDSDAGKEILRLLLEREENKPAIATKQDQPKALPALPKSKTQTDALLPENLETMFQKIIAEK